jgi:D-tyrosyl-tRNA(Tyr) deacylase
MRAVLQRVRRARVVVDDEEVGRIGAGWAILLGVGRGDNAATTSRLVDKIVGLRAFEDDEGRMNRSAQDINAEFLVISQFTLYADLTRGRRPGFTLAAAPDEAEPLVDAFVKLLRSRGFRVATGRFGALMDVELVNHGPATFVLATDEWEPVR